MFNGIMIWRIGWQIYEMNSFQKTSCSQCFSHQYSFVTGCIIPDKGGELCRIFSSSPTVMIELVPVWFSSGSTVPYTPNATPRVLVFPSIVSFMSLYVLNSFNGCPSFLLMPVFW